MKRLFIAACFIGCCNMLTACGSNEESANNSTEINTTESVSTETNAADGAAAGSELEQSLAGADAASDAPVVPTTTASSNGVRLNPPHGEPGHNCDLPVGAPLDGSAPAQPVAPANVVPPATASPAVGSGKINPPHGQPGHNCDYPVGARLP